MYGKITNQFKVLITFFDRFLKPYDWIHSYLKTHHIKVRIPHKKGMSIDDYYVLASMIENQKSLSGDILLLIHSEINDEVIKSCGKMVDVITFEQSDEDLNIFKLLSKIPSKKYDTIIAPFVLNNVYNYDKVIQELARITRDGGNHIFMVCSFAQLYKGYLWGFTAAALGYICKKNYPSKIITPISYGNVLTGRYLIEGKKVDTVSQDSLNYSDMYFPVVIGVCINK